MALIFKLRKNKNSRASLHIQNQNDSKNFLLEASKIPVSVDFRNNNNMEYDKSFLKLDKKNNSLNKVKNNISQIKYMSENNKTKRKPFHFSCNSCEKNIILPSILPHFTIKIQIKDKKKKKSTKNRSFSINNNENKGKLSIHQSKGKNIDLYNFLNIKCDGLIKNEKTIGNMVKYSTFFNNYKAKKNKFYFKD